MNCESTLKAMNSNKMSTNKFAFPKVPIVVKKKSSYKITQHLFRDTIIYDSKDMNFFKDKYERVTLFNQQNVLTNSCRLVAKIRTINGQFLEKSCDGIVRLIGQEQFEVLFMALCSIINQEIRIRGLISILSTNKVEKSDPELKTEDRWSQTDETRLEKVTVSRKRRMRRHLAPYVVQDFQVPDKIRKVVVDVSKDTESTSNSSQKEKDIPDLGYLHDDYSNNSTISDFSASIPELLTNPTTFLKNIDNYTDKHEIPDKPSISNENSLNNTKTHEMTINNELQRSVTIQENCFNLILPDNSSIMLPGKPEDHFHIATEDNLNFVDPVSRRKLVDIQRIIDLKFCLTPVDEEGNLPIHMAVMNEDLHLLKRQCFMLNLKGSSVDIEANGLTPLKLSLFNESVSATGLLLSFDADPLSLDDTHSTYFHTAAELKTEHLSVLLQYCKNNARKILSENEDLQSPGWEEKPDDELSSRLMDHLLSIYDSQGYTPLMLATNLGLYHNVRLLLSHSPASINSASPTAGNTALYLACYAACNVAAERGNKSKLVDHFRQTIEILLDYGADPTIDNYSGSNISVLLIDFQCPELSLLIANKGPASKFKNSTEINDSLMFIKDGHEMKKIKEKDSKERSELSSFRKTKKENPVILENLLSKSDTKTEPILSKVQTDLAKITTNATKIASNPIKTPDNSKSLTNSTQNPTGSPHSNKVNIEFVTKLNQLKKSALQTSNVTKIASNPIQTPNNSKCLTNSTKNPTGSPHSNKVNIEFVTKLNQLKKSTLQTSNVTKIASNPIQTPDNSKCLTNSTKNPTDSPHSNKVNIVFDTKMTQIKKSTLQTKKSLESNENSCKILSNVIINKPDQIILTPVNNTIKLRDSSSSNSRLKMDSSMYLKSMFCKVKDKGNLSQNKKARITPNITSADYDPNDPLADSNTVQNNTPPLDIKLLYTSSENPLKNHFNSNEYNNSIKNLIKTENISLASPTVKKTKPKTYVKKTVCTKKSINDKNEVVGPPKTCKRSLSDSE